MAFKSKTPSKGLRQKTPLKAKAGFKPKAPMQAKASLQSTPPSPADQKKALQKATVRLLEKAKREAAEQGVDLSEWEAEFIDSVAQRVKTYGRAFADPDKGAIDGTLSLMQGLKLREIRKKVRTKAAKNQPDPPDEE
ncbi:hypothetical protein Q1W73_15805 [Asticcacaulis sp. ZE23SCel15]|uniref:hypothetical protein n=1 Tax=Asticcacaulis sp. ZE23SCel15 TaxID=3059027 RepID=UPI00265DCCA6|nr:hypothetical protein [Asticcacaulis sp. ZE23SCel15]WKL57109.1 hypothetical protein Q1W73_15805 [Asticcacaulis sp. ZE23SCel15]